MQERFGGPGVGELLHQARRRRRISLEKAARDTFISADHIRRLEGGDLTFLSPVYVRAYLREYAAYLRLDPEPLLDTLGSLRDEDEARVLAEAARRGRDRPRLAAALQLVIVLAAVVWATTILLSAGREDASPEPASGTAAASEQEPSDGPQAARKKGAGGRATVSFEDGMKVRVVASRARCWIEVISDGRVTFSGILEMGERRVFEADGDMRISLGFPAGVELAVNGFAVGSPGGQDPLQVVLPTDFETLSRRSL